MFVPREFIRQTIDNHLFQSSSWEDFSPVSSSNFSFIPVFDIMMKSFLIFVMLMIWGYEAGFQLLCYVNSDFVLRPLLVICLLMTRMIRLRVMMFIALLFGYYAKKKHRGSYAYFAESGSCLFSSANKWVIDSGASDHMTGNSNIFSDFSTHASVAHVTIADGSTTKVLGSGTVNLSPSISLSSVLSLPKFSFNLLSVTKITNNLQCSVKFYPDYCIFKDLKTKRVIGRGRKFDGLYVFEPEISKSLVGLSSSSPFEVHCRLGHPSLQSLKKLCPEFSHLSSLKCDSCEFAKHQRVHLSPRVNKRVASPFELVHSDVWGPCPVTSKSGFKYFVTFVDDYSRVTWLYLMKNRSEVFTHFCSFVAEIKTQFHVTVQTLRSDNAKEYFSESI